MTEKKMDARRKKWTKAYATEYFKKEIVANVVPLTKPNIKKFSNAFYSAIYKSKEITWEELFETIGLNFEDIHNKQRMFGRKKYWVREKLIEYFEKEILPSNKGLKRRDLVKEHHAFCKGMENSKEITWNELYALFGLDYEAIKREPAYWNRNRLITYMWDLIANKEPVNLTALSQNHEPFYKALMRSKEITIEELCEICRLDYKLVRRERRYQSDNDARVKLIELYGQGKSLNTSKDIRKEDPALYNYLLERGNGILQRGIEMVGFKLTKDNSVPDIRINNLLYLQVLGHHFQSVLSEIFNIVRLGVQDNSEIISGYKPDFICKKDGTWYDAKISTFGVNTHILEGTYLEKAERLIYVYLVTSSKLDIEIPTNVEVVHVNEFLNMIKNIEEKIFLKGKLSLLSELHMHFNETSF